MFTKTRHVHRRTMAAGCCSFAVLRRSDRRRVRLRRRKAHEPLRGRRPGDPIGPGANRFEAAADRKIDPGIVAIVSAGDVAQPRGRSSGSAGRRRAARRTRRGERRQLLRHPRPRDGLARSPLDLRAGLLQAALGQAAEGRRAADRTTVRRAARRATRRRRDRERPGEHAGRQRPRARRAARVPVHLPAVAAVLPLARRVAAAAAARRPGDRRDVLRAANRLELHRPVGVRPQLRHRPGPRARDRLQPVHGLALPRGGRDARASASGAAAHARDPGTDDPVQLADGRRSRRVAGDLPAALPLLDGDRGCASSR